MKKTLFPKKHPSHQIDIIFPEETAIPSLVLTHTRPSEFSELKAKVNLIEKYIENLKAEIEVRKMFVKDKFYLLKNSNSEQNVCVSAEKTKVTELLQQQIQNLIQENASKNTIIKILVENHTFDNSNSKLTVSEEFTTVNSKFRHKRSRPRKHKEEVDLNWSNRYEILYISDSNTEIESEDSDDISTTDTSTDSNTRPAYTHRIHQRNDNLKKVNKTKNKITKNVNRSNDIRVRSEDINLKITITFHSKIQIRTKIQQILET